MPISRMQQPRQMYGLGSLVKSIGKTVKKIVKSPVAKVAMLGFGANALMPGGLGSLFSGGSGLTGILGKGKSILDGLTGAQKITGALALGGAFAGMEDQQVEELRQNPEALRSYLAQYYRNLNQNASDEEVNRFVEANMTEYKANGGRIGYREGALAMGPGLGRPLGGGGSGITTLPDGTIYNPGRPIPGRPLGGGPSPYEGPMKTQEQFGANARFTDQQAFDDAYKNYTQKYQDYNRPPDNMFFSRIMPATPVPFQAQVMPFAQQANSSSPMAQIAGMADGGRIGYNEGTGDPTYTGNNIEDLPRGLQIDTTTSNPIPDDAPQQEISEVAKIMLGPGRSGIGEPEDGTMKGYQFFRKKYLPKKVTEIAENYGIEENEVLRMIRDEMMQYIDAPKSLEKPEMAKGGRMGYNEGTPEIGMIDPNKAKQAKQMIGMGADQDLISTITGLTKEQVEFLMREDKAYGGRMGFAMGNPEENAVQASGIMDLPLNQNPAGITELDLRETGGFIPPVGVKEKADDIPAMLSNNEFVFTADAVRGMGDGNVNKGAQRMYDMMKKLEKGGRV